MHGLCEQDAINKFVHDMFRAATVDMCHEFAMTLNKEGEQNTTAHVHMSEREALDMVGEAVERVTLTDGSKRRAWLQLAATALGHVVAIDLGTGNISPGIRGSRG